MSRLPIVHMTLYKHGIGFYRRRGSVSGEAVSLTFRREEMDDLLKKPDRARSWGRPGVGG